MRSDATKGPFAVVQLLSLIPRAPRQGLTLLYDGVEAGLEDAFMQVPRKPRVLSQVLDLGDTHTLWGMIGS